MFWLFNPETTRQTSSGRLSAFPLVPPPPRTHTGGCKVACAINKALTCATPKHSEGGCLEVPIRGIGVDVVSPVQETDATKDSRGEMVFQAGLEALSDVTLTVDYQLSCEFCCI